MTDKVNRYECLIDTLYRFACGPWPPAGQAFAWRSPDEIRQALRWIDQLHRKHEQEEEQIEFDRHLMRDQRRRAKASSVAKLVQLPPKPGA